MQVATLFRESATLGAAGMMESPAVTTSTSSTPPPPPLSSSPLPPLSPTTTIPQLNSETENASAPETATEPQSPIPSTSPPSARLSSSPLPSPTSQPSTPPMAASCLMPLSPNRISPVPEAVPATTNHNTSISNSSNSSCTSSSGSSSSTSSPLISPTIPVDDHIETVPSRLIQSLPLSIPASPTSPPPPLPPPPPPPPSSTELFNQQSQIDELPGSNSAQSPQNSPSNELHENKSFSTTTPIIPMTTDDHYEADSDHLASESIPENLTIENQTKSINDCHNHQTIAEDLRNFVVDSNDQQDQQLTSTEESSMLVDEEMPEAVAGSSMSPTCSASSSLSVDQSQHVLINSRENHDNDNNVDNNSSMNRIDDQLTDSDDRDNAIECDERTNLNLQQMIDEDEHQHEQHHSLHHLHQHHHHLHQQQHHQLHHATELDSLQQSNPCISNENTQSSIENDRNNTQIGVIDEERQQLSTMNATSNDDTTQLHSMQLDLIAAHHRSHHQQQQQHFEHHQQLEQQQHHSHEHDDDHHHHFHHQQQQQHQHPFQMHMDQQQQQQHHHQQQHQQQQQQQHEQNLHHQRQLQQQIQMHQFHQQQQQHHQQQMQQHMQHHHQLQQQQQQQQHHHQQQHRQPHQLTCIDDLMIDDHHDVDHSNRYKMLSPMVKHENQDDGYETSAGDVMTPNSHTSSSQHPMTPHQMHAVGTSATAVSNVLVPKIEIPPPPPSSSSVDDPYNFIDDELNSSMHMMSPASGGPMSMRQQGYPHHQTGPPGSGTGSLSAASLLGGSLLPMVNRGQLIGVPGVLETNSGLSDLSQPKKRGRKKKIRDENGTIVNGILKPVVHKERKKHDRFNGMPEEEVSKRTLPDHLTNNLDIIIIGINPGLFAAYKGHHYAGPGNHFWKCLYLSGLTHEQMTAEEDYKLLDIGIGFTNMVERATKGSADLTRKEIKEGCRVLLDKLRKFRPKIAVFNGKLIFEVFSGKKDFNFGRQSECIEGTNTYMWVMPSSSARCAQLPRAADKVPFYAALKKFRDYLNGLIPHIDDTECVFNDPKYKVCCETEPKTDNLIYTDITDLSNCNLTNNNSNTTMLINNNNNNSIGNGKTALDSVVMAGDLLTPGKKKRGRPKKIKGLGLDCTIGGGLGLGDDNSSGLTKMSPTSLRLGSPTRNNNNLSLNNCNMAATDSMMPKKKRGRPKKIKTSASPLSNGPVTNCGDLLMNSSGTSGQLLNHNSNSNGLTSGLENINNIDMNQNSPTNGGPVLSANSFGGSLTAQGRLFSPPMHSPSTVGSSYCPIVMNAPSSTPPINNSNSNTNSYHNSHHHHHHSHPHQMAHHHHHHHPHHHHQAQHHHPYHQQQYTTTTHSDLSSEISAAISSEHLGESPTPTSPSLGAHDFDPPNSMQTDDTNPNDLRYSSPASTISEHHHQQQQQQQQQHQHHQQLLGGYPTYHNPGSNNSYLSTGGGGSSNDGNQNDGYLTNQQQSTTNGQQQQQQQQQMSDVSSKSLSGLESLVHQIPTMSDGPDGPTQSSSNSSPSSIIAAHLQSSANQSSGDHTNSNTEQYGTSCLYSDYGNSVQQQSQSTSSSASPPSASVSSSTTTSTMLLSPRHHYTSSIGSYSPNVIASNSTISASVSSPSPSSPSPSSSSILANNSSNSLGYGSLITSNFSVSSLTSNSYPTSSYRTNLMATSSPSPNAHQLNGIAGTIGVGGGSGSGGGSSGSSPMYMEQPQMPLPVNPLYHHHHHHHHNPYAQHTGYASYGAGPIAPSIATSSSASSPSPIPSPVPPQSHQTPQPPTIHMPSPNYPYGYGNVGGYPQPHHHHPGVHHHHHHHPHHPAAVHHPAAGYLSTHPSMFDRIKPDIGYGGF